MRVRQVNCGSVIWLAAVCIGATSWAQERLDNWPEWRGPEANGFAAHGDPPTEWSEAKNIKWKVAIPGKGTSTPIVWGDKVFVLTAIELDRTAEPREPASDESTALKASSPFRYVAQPEQATLSSGTAAEKSDATPPAAAPASGNAGGGRTGKEIPKPTHFHRFVVLCLDRNTGKTLWQRTAVELVPHQGHHETGSFAAGSPVTDGKYLYVSFGSNGIYCYDLDGNLQWQKDLGDMQMKFGFGEGASPVLAADRLIVDWDHEDGSKLIALNAHTGDVVWQTPRNEVSTWTSPFVTEFNGRYQVVVNGGKRARGYDLETGDVLWECGGQTGNPIPVPLRFENLAICISGFRGAAAYAIPLDAAGDITDTEKIAWKHTKGTPYVSSAALVGDRLYFTKDRAAIVTCLNARTGEPIIDEKRLPAAEDMYASPVAAAGRVYFTGRNGATVVIDATKDEVDVLAENKLDDTFSASPAIVGKEIFLRGDANVYCIAEQ